MKDTHEASQSPDALPENKNNLDLMIQDLNRYQQFQANLNKGLVSTKSKNAQSGRNLNEITEAAERTVSNQKQHIQENIYIPSSSMLGPQKMDTYEVYNSAGKRPKVNHQYKYN